MKPTLFISDLHLSAARPATLAAFLAFCAGPAREAGALYVLGDLFDSWIGDDQAREPLAAAVVRALAALAAASTSVHLMRGNRDLLLGPRFAAAAGAELLADEVVADVAGVPTLLLHGDTLCTDDVDYQRFRVWANDPSRQQRFLRLPYVVRRLIIAFLRRRSRAATAQKAEAIMDVNAAAVGDAFARYGVTRIVHGHTHRPARHEFVQRGQHCERLVLPDWYDTGGYLAIGDAGAGFRSLPAAR
jgi:UDP-2,3-diacylglucosamine hydrolase